MPALTFMPSPVGSAEEFVAQALARETAAARRYRAAARRMRERGEHLLARLFEALAAAKAQHAADDARRFSPAPSGQPVEIGAWESLEEDVPEDGSRLLTPFAVLAEAVRSEERAFAMFSYAAAAAPDEQVRALAEALAKQALARAGEFRRERRKAYRAEPVDGRRARSEAPGGVAEFLRLCVEIEARAADYHRALAASLRNRDAVAAAFAGVAEDEEGCARQAAARIGGDLPSGVRPMSPTIEGGLRRLEAGFERYAEIAGCTADAGVLQEAQALAARAVRRLRQAHLALTTPPPNEPGGGSGGSSAGPEPAVRG